MFKLNTPFDFRDEFTSIYYEELSIFVVLIRNIINHSKRSYIFVNDETNLDKMFNSKINKKIYTKFGIIAYTHPILRSSENKNVISH